MSDDDQFPSASQYRDQWRQDRAAARPGLFQRWRLAVRNASRASVIGWSVAVGLVGVSLLAILVASLVGAFEQEDEVAVDIDPVPNVEPEAVSWSVEDLMRSACETGTVQEGHDGGLFSGSASGWCVPANSGGMIHFVIEDSQFMAENRVQGPEGNLFDFYAMEPLDGGEYLLIGARASDGSNPLERLEPEWGVLSQPVAP